MRRRIIPTLRASTGVTGGPELTHHRCATTFANDRHVGVSFSSIGQGSEYIVNEAPRWRGTTARGRFIPSIPATPLAVLAVLAHAGERGLSRDAFQEEARPSYLARVATIGGRNDVAIAALDTALSIPSNASRESIRTSPNFASLR